MKSCPLLVEFHTPWHYTANTYNTLCVAQVAIVHIIPGRGSHSENQQAKIEPKRIAYLNEKNYKWVYRNDS